MCDIKKENKTYINNILKDMSNKIFLLNNLVDKYKKIEEDFNILEYKYESLSEKYQKLKKNKYHESILLNYEKKKINNINEKLEKKYTNLKNETLCLICGSERRNIILLPCKHYILCHNCEKNNYNISKDRKCPVCRQNYNDTMILYT